jgi:metal-responsive CopG/Arc/MetJ family transcriptional regulator
LAKIPLGLRIDEGLLEKLDRWRAQQPVPPARTSVVEKALEEFLDRHLKGEADGQKG